MNRFEKPTGFREDPKILEAIDRIAQERGMKRSDVIREAIREKLRKMKSETEAQLIITTEKRES